MIKFVVKKDGSKETFDPEKVKKGVRLAARAANLAEDKVEELAEAILAKVIGFAGDKEEITSPEIREVALNELDIMDPVVSAAWRNYGQKKE